MKSKFELSLKLLCIIHNQATNRKQKHIVAEKITRLQMKAEQMGYNFNVEWRAS